MLAPSARSSSGSTVLTVAFVPTGMKTGVGTSPCAVRSVPARAGPSVAVSANAVKLVSLAVTGPTDGDVGRQRLGQPEPEDAVVGVDAEHAGPTAPALRHPDDEKSVGARREVIRFGRVERPNNGVTAIRST